MTEPMSTDLVYQSASLHDRQAYAAAIADAGELVPAGFRNANGSPNPAKLLLAFEYGAMLGLHPVASLQGINVIKGKASPAPALMTALVRRAGHKLRVRQTGSWPETFKVTVTVVRSDDTSNPFEATWDEAKAKRAKLLPASGDSSWAKYPEAMCTWRAVSEVCRMAAEDVMFGVHYIPEELGANVNEAGEVLEGEIVEEPSVPDLPSKILAKQRGNVRESDPGPRHNGKRGHASETRVTAGPDVEPTRTGANRPGPSRPVTSPGTGRASAELYPQTQNLAKAGNADEPSEETRAAVADYVERIGAEDDIERLRDLHGDASTHGLLASPTADGRRLNDVFYQRREAILQAQEMPPALDGIEDDA